MINEMNKLSIRYLSGVVKFSETVTEHFLLPELLEESLPLTQLVVLLQCSLEQTADVGVVGQHEAGHAVC